MEASIIEVKKQEECNFFETFLPFLVLSYFEIRQTSLRYFFFNWQSLLALKQT